MPCGRVHTLRIQWFSSGKSWRLKGFPYNQFPSSKCIDYLHIPFFLTHCFLRVFWSTPKEGIIVWLLGVHHDVLSDYPFMFGVGRSKECNTKSKSKKNPALHLSHLNLGLKWEKKTCFTVLTHRSQALQNDFPPHGHVRPCLPASHLDPLNSIPTQPSWDAEGRETPQLPEHTYPTHPRIIAVLYIYILYIVLILINHRVWLWPFGDARNKLRFSSKLVVIYILWDILIRNLLTLPFQSPRLDDDTL